MAKKRDLSSKIRKKEGSGLPQKVSLSPTPKNFEAVKEQADTIHNEKKSPSPTPLKKKVETTRLNVVLERGVVKEIKKAVAEKETTIKEYITGLVKKDLNIK